MREFSNGKKNYKVPPKKVMVPPCSNNLATGLGLGLRLGLELVGVRVTNSRG